MEDNCSVQRLVWSDFEKYLSGERNWLIIFAKIFHNPGMIFSVCYRIEHSLLYCSNNIGYRALGQVLYPLYFFITYYILSYHIEPVVKIGKGLLLHNRNIVITDAATLGDDVCIMGQTTIGTDFFPGEVKIQIGNRVKIGTGARIIAKNSLIIADDVMIGANAVVIKSILQKKVVCVGIPARIVKKL